MLSVRPALAGGGGEGVTATGIRHNAWTEYADTGFCAGAPRATSQRVRVEGSVTSLSWIPREAVEGITKIPFEVSVARYDEPPPDRLTEADLETLRDAGRFRFVNQLRAWAEVEDGKIVRYGYEGRSLLGKTRVKLGRFLVAVPPVSFPVLHREPVATETEVRFVQTVGGRTGVPAPRTVKHPPFAQWAAPTAWTTLALSLRADGTSTGELVGASSFPRHWVYDGHGNLAEKSGLIDFREWYRTAFGTHSPWGDQDARALVTAVETALERELSRAIIDAEPRFVRLRAGQSLVQQGDEGTDVFLLFDGVMQVIRDRQVIAEVGPGAILGEMALVDDARRKATLRAATHCRVAVMPGQHLDRKALAQVAVPRRSTPETRARDALVPGGGGGA